MSLTRSTRFRILARDGFHCRYCGRGAPDVVLEVDHVHPVSKGGTDDDANLVTACFDCNRGKYTRRLRDGAPATAAPVETVPHPDTCPECRPFRYCAAFAEKPSESGGITAFYRCACGRHWYTSWGRPVHRIPRTEIGALLDELNDGAAWAAAHSAAHDTCRSH